MRFLKFSILTILLSTFFIACEKEKVAAPEPTPDGLPIPVPETKPVQGKWMGNRYSHDKSVPYSFGFDVKADAKLEVLNASKQVIGAGTWSFDNDVFTAAYVITATGITYSVRSTFFDKPDNIEGTWGFDNNNSNGGSWGMSRFN